MTCTNSSNDRLVLRQNVEINSNEYFSCDLFFREWNRRPCGLETSLRNHQEKCLWVKSYFNDFLWFIEQLSVEIFIYSSFVTIDDVIFLFSKNFRHNGSAFFGEMCRSSSLHVVARMVNTRGSTQISRHRSSDWDNIGLSCRLNRLNKHSRWDEWQDKVSFCSLICFNWRMPARVPLFSLGLKVHRSPCGHSGRLSEVVLTHYHRREVRNSIYRYWKIHIDYRSKFSYRFISSISIIYDNTIINNDHYKYFCDTTWHH